MRARAGVLLVLILAVVAAGCGGGGEDRDAYVKALNKSQTGLAQRFAALQSRITPTSNAAQDIKTLRAYEAAVRTTVRDLRAVDPPDGLAPLHRRFIDEVAAYGSALRKTRAELDRDDPRAILAAQGRLRSAVTAAGRRLDATIRAINQKLKG
jgi:hypothetical protein